MAVKMTNEACMKLTDADHKLMADAVAMIAKDPSGDAWMIGALLALISRVAAIDTE